MTILVGSQRGGARDLALHLLKDENEHIEVHEVRGFVSPTVMGALNEAYAMSRATKCRRFLYSLSANPPPDQAVSTDDLISFINESEERLGLTGQPRVIVFHEKQGRRHAHCVWSRIKADELKAVHIAYDHKTLVQLSREIFLRRGWEVPPGLIDRRDRDPRSFTLAEWQQAKRNGKDPRDIKAALQGAWAVSDNKASLVQALQERGFKLARGDRGRIVAIDTSLEVYSFPRWAKQKTAAVRDRIGDEADLPSLAEQQALISKGMSAALTRLQDDVARCADAARLRFESRRKALVVKQRAERGALKRSQEADWDAANKERQARFRCGLKGVWDYLRGEHRRIKKRNEAEASAQQESYRETMDALIQRHLKERQRIEIFKLRHKARAQSIMRDLTQEQQDYDLRPAP